LISIFFVNQSSANSFTEDYLYDVQLGNISVGKSVVSVLIKGNEIRVSANTKSEGFLDLFYNYESELITNSYKEENIWKADNFLVNGILNSNKRYTNVNWPKNNKELYYRTIPILDLKKVYNVSKSSLKNVIDPITAILKVIENIKKESPCDIKLRIFDGRRRYDLLTKHLGKTFLKNDRPKSFSGNAIICGIKIIPLGGHRRNSKWQPEEDQFSDFKMFFGRTTSGALFPVRVSLERWFGIVTVRLLKSNL
jgi:hypothetical protein